MTLPAVILRQAHFFGDGLDRRASRLLYAFKKGIPEGCVDNFSGHEGPLSAPVLGVESGHIDLRKGVDSAGTRAGIVLDRQFDSIRGQKAFAEGFCELVIDKGDVHYHC